MHFRESKKVGKNKEIEMIEWVKKECKVNGDLDSLVDWNELSKSKTDDVLREDTHKKKCFF